MQGSELRCGNFVTVNNPVSWAEIKGIHCVVTGIKEDYRFPESAHSIGLQREYHSYNQLSQFVEPIPLTEEWLFEFGFEKKENNWKQLCICNDWTYIYWERLAGVELSVNKYSVMLTHIKYVHQLQNLYFALTGEELKQNLPNKNENKSRSKSGNKD